MGVCISSEIQDQRSLNKLIEKQLKLTAREANAIKLLLLGPGGSGKSTILKQMMILHTNGFSEQEILKRKTIIRLNVIECMSALMKAMEKLEINFGNSELTIVQNHIDFVKILQEKKAADELLPSLLDALNRLWKDVGVQKCYRRRNEFVLDDCAKYFLDNLDRICSFSYQPTNQDILNSHATTTGLQEITFEAHTTMFRVFDVGGQRSERKKWIHQFENVDSVIFIAALSDYNSLLAEDTSQNALMEALELFENMLALEWFCQKPMILFMNKKDLFEQKLHLFPLYEHFPEYEGGDNLKEGIKFMTDEFKKRNKNSSRMLYVHSTCATDTDQVEKVIGSVLNLIMGLNAEKSGME